LDIAEGLNMPLRQIQRGGQQSGADARIILDDKGGILGLILHIGPNLAMTEKTANFADAKLEWIDGVE